MSCSHRFIGLHVENSLFPNWDIDHFFIGTFNPEWDRPNASNAEYFYGRSAYFWDAISIFFEDKPFEWSDNNKEHMIAFCKRHKIGFTDLISSVMDADVNNETHRARIFTVKDNELEKFENINWNTERIIEYLRVNKPKHLYFTLLAGNKGSIFTKEIQKVEQAAKTLNVTSKRLHSPTGANVGNGSPRLHELVERWSVGSDLPYVDLEKYPYIIGSKSDKIDKVRKSNKKSCVGILDRYILSVDESGKCSIVDVISTEQLKVLPTLVKVIIPHIMDVHGYRIDLLSKSKSKTPKNTRTLAKEVIQFLQENY